MLPLPYSAPVAPLPNEVDHADAPKVSIGWCGGEVFASHLVNNSVQVMRIGWNDRRSGAPLRHTAGGQGMVTVDVE